MLDTEAGVYLEMDVSETDRFDRLLRCVWLEGGTMVNEALVAGGMPRCPPPRRT